MDGEYKMAQVDEQCGWVDKIKERESKATPGPWWIGLGSGFHLCTGVFAGDGFWIADCLTDKMLDKQYAVEDHRPNMRFIAEARTDIPRLLEAGEQMAFVLEKIIRQRCENKVCTSCNLHPACEALYLWKVGKPEWE